MHMRNNEPITAKNDIPYSSIIFASRMKNAAEDTNNCTKLTTIVQFREFSDGLDSFDTGG